MDATTALRWDAIDTVMLDMDGTLLDLRFDNMFWRELVPARYAAARGLSPDRAWAELEPHYRRTRGSLDWYCLDYWSRELDLDIVALKTEVAGDIALLPGVPDFLARVRGRCTRLLLVTNAHHDSLALKLERTGIGGAFDRIVSSHSLGLPKEHPGFWGSLQQLERFEAARTLFVDDSLPVLESARAFGIGWLRAVACPDSGRELLDTPGFVAVRGVAELLDDG